MTNKMIIRESILGKAVGLMFHRRLDDTAMVFPLKKEEIVSLHMLFVFFPIDVLYLDSEKKVVKIKESLKPFTFYNPKNKAVYIIELPKGTIERTKTTINDKIGF